MCPLRLELSRLDSGHTWQWFMVEGRAGEKSCDARFLENGSVWSCLFIGYFFEHRECNTLKKSDSSRVESAV